MKNTVIDLVCIVSDMLVLFGCGLWAAVGGIEWAAGDYRGAVQAAAAIGLLASTRIAMPALVAWLDGVRDRWLERLWEEHRR